MSSNCQWLFEDGGTMLFENGDIMIQEACVPLGGRYSSGGVDPTIGPVTNQGRNNAAVMRIVRQFMADMA